MINNTIGQLVKAYRPELIAELKDISPESTLTDLAQIRQLFSSYCKVNKITGTKMRTRWDRDIVQKRLLFMAIVLHLYQPSVYDKRIRHIRIMHGLIKAVDQNLQVGKGRISNLARWAVVEKARYPDFAEKIQKTLTDMGF